MALIDELSPFGIDFSTRTCKDPLAYSAFMLEKVSRTFALNIKVLPFALRKPVLLAYLFCRIADTVEDDPEMDGQLKQEHLERFKTIFDYSDSREKTLAHARLFTDNLPEAWKKSDTRDWNHILSNYIEWPLESYLNLSDENCAILRKWICEMSDGMILYGLKEKNSGRLMSLSTLAELENYCYYVAGTVGYMLSDLFLNYSPLITVKRYTLLTEHSNSFGLGLQLTNIIKDVAEDMERDICFIPEELAQKHGIRTTQLLNPDYQKQSLCVMKDMILQALSHLDNAITYTCHLPRLEPKIRIFCLWPLFMAVETLLKATQE